jgi:ankyrin repeat protein
VADADDLPFGWKKAVSYVLTLEHPSGTSLGYAKRNPDKTFKLCPKAIDWGWSQFITSDRIQQEGYIHNDALTVRAQVTVKSSSVSIDAMDAELYLKCAVEEGNAEAVRACLAQGASVNCQFKDDLYTPLHTACSASSTIAGSLDVLHLLLEKGADGNACNKWRETPLLIAANNGNKAAVEALLDHGADPSLCSEAGWSALTFAAHKGYDSIVDLLISAGAPVNCRVIEDFSTPLHKACAGSKPGHLSAVKQLLDANADVHALNKWRETPLLTAANHGQVAAVEALLAKGADPCKCTDTGWSPLSIAAYKGHDDVVRLLLEEGAPTEEADPTLSALLQAATKGLPETVELLLKHGADHTVTTKKGDTALSILVEQNLIDAAVEMVTEYKASVPRCSRDRKKVQRARLLINLRVKQQQKEGLLLSSHSDTTDDDSDNDDEQDSAGSSPLHDEESMISRGEKSSSKVVRMKKKGHKSKTRSANAEEKAREAEAALLRVLEQEEMAQKLGAAASSKKAAKKKKRRDKERQQQKQKEEQERREREEREAQERERQNRIREARLQKEREKREQEMKEMAEREAALARGIQRRKKEQERKEQLERIKMQEQQQQQLNAMTTAVPASPSRKKEKTIKGKPKKQETQTTVITTSNLTEQRSKGGLKNNYPTNSAQSSVKQTPVPKRGWETKQDAQMELLQGASTNAWHPTQPPSQTLNNSSSTRTVSALQQVIMETPYSQEQSTYLPQRYISSPPPATVVMDNNTINFVQHQRIVSPSVPIPHSTHSLSPNIQQPPPSTVDEYLENMANDVIDFLEFDSPSAVYTGEVRRISSGRLPEMRMMQQSALVNGGAGGGNAPHVEYPQVGIYRQDQLRDLLLRCSRICADPSSPPVPAVSEDAVRAIFYRWSLRAAHASSPFIDPVIPSWTSPDELVAFFQRQFISESRKYADSSGLTNIEHLREIGRLVADSCLAAAKNVMHCQSKVKSQFPRDWSDSSIGLSASQSLDRNGGSFISISWQGRVSVQLRSNTFSALEARYCGPPQRVLASMFAVIKRYNTRQMLTAGTAFDKRLSQTFVSTIGRELQATVEGWSDPLSVTGSNTFCGLFPDVDRLFGGFLPFGKEDGGGEISLLEKGGSVVIMPPVDNNTAALYFHSMVDMLENPEKTRPLSFAVIIPSECFHDLKAPPSIGDLPSLDPRLGGRHGRYVRAVEVISAGQHTYQCGVGEGVSKVSQSGSLFVLLQNDLGMRKFPANENSLLNIMFSTSPGYLKSDSAIVAGAVGLQQAVAQVNIPSPSTQVGFSGFSVDPNCAPASPSPFLTGNSFSGGFLGYKNDHMKGRPRGRLFELEDYGNELDAVNDVDVVSGMLNNLGVNMFGNVSSQEVDIEAISLMGISNDGGTTGTPSGVGPFG